MTKRIIGFKDGVKELKKAKQEKNYLSNLIVDSKVSIFEKGSSISIFSGKVTKIEEQKKSSVPKRIEIKINYCKDYPNLRGQTVVNNTFLIKKEEDKIAA